MKEEIAAVLREHSQDGTVEGGLWAGLCGRMARALAEQGLGFEPLLLVFSEHGVSEMPMYPLFNPSPALGRLVVDMTLRRAEAFAVGWFSGASCASGSTVAEVGAAAASPEAQLTVCLEVPGETRFEVATLKHDGGLGEPRRLRAKAGDEQALSGHMAWLLPQNEALRLDVTAPYSLSFGVPGEEAESIARRLITEGGQ